MSGDRDLDLCGEGDARAFRSGPADRTESAPLSRLEARALRFITRYLAENTFQPSFREIASHLGLKSTKQVSDLLLALEMKGYVERMGQQSRSVRLLRVRLLPEIVELHAHPGSALSGFAPSLLLDPRLIPSGGAAAYFVVGRAADDTLARGDVVFVQAETEWAVGAQLLVGTVDGACTVRRIFSPEDIAPGEIVHGRVLALLRLIPGLTPET